VETCLGREAGQLSGALIFLFFDLAGGVGVLEVL